MDDDRNVAKNPATEDEKTILRNFVARDATPEERDSFLVKNYAHLNEKARGVFQDMSPTDQYRVIFDGPMKESRDPVEILYGRVKRFLDMELQLRALSGRTGKEQQTSVKKQPSKKMQELSARIAHSLDNPIYEEVPAHERRCAGVDQKLEDAKPKVMEGTVKGIGGVIEALQKKYAMHKGERVKVLGEAKDLWKVEGERTIPKCQVNTGWKWVLKGAEDEAKKKAEEDAKKKAAKEDRDRDGKKSQPRLQEAKRQAAEAKKADEAKEDKKASKDGKNKKEADKKDKKEGKEKDPKKDKDKAKEKEKEKEKSKDKAKEKEKEKSKTKKSEEAKDRGASKAKKRKHASDSEEEEASCASSRKRPKKKAKSSERRQKSRTKSQKQKRRRSSDDSEGEDSS
ncbi:fadB [Symbiodinium natans]|uniref:FadB protein n=1 Tax=Symbiodinium natans TaxID=878477 RepID=A0A812LAQ6_9DINO|nr:fadB [Symbiodinium natans]